MSAACRSCLRSFSGPGDRNTASALIADHGWDDAIAKPVAAGGSRGLIRFRGGGDAGVRSHVETLLARGPVLLQPFVPTVLSVGEYSLFFIDGELTHTVLKKPAPGDFRVQPEWGGTFALVRPPAALVDVAAAVLREFPPLLYARVDLVIDNDGEPALMELELIEPRLFLRVAPAAAETLAAAIHARIR